MFCFKRFVIVNYNIGPCQGSSWTRYLGGGGGGVSEYIHIFMFTYRNIFKVLKFIVYGIKKNNALSKCYLEYFFLEYLVIRNNNNLFTSFS